VNSVDINRTMPARADEQAIGSVNLRPSADQNSLAP
jgi:hypothetical protein